MLDSRRLGAAWTLDRIWERLGIGAAIRRVADGRRLDGDAVERVVFALVASGRASPGRSWPRPAGSRERVAIDGCPGFTDDAAYAAMDFLLDALDEIAAEVFGSVAHLLNLDLDIVFVDTTVHLLGDRDRRRRRRAGRPGRRRRGQQPGRGRDAGVRALQGPPRRPAAGGDRDGGHPRRGPGAVLDLPRRHRRHRDHPHRSRTTWAGGGCAGWCGWPTAGSPPPPTGPTSPAAAGTTSTPRSCATPTPRPPPRWPAPAATAPWPTTCGSRRSRSPPAGTATATTAPAPSGS